MPHAKSLSQGLLATVLVAVLESASPSLVRATEIASLVGTNVAVERDRAGDVLHQIQVDTDAAASGNARLTLGDGTNAFVQPTFAQAFSTIRPGNQATYWVNLNADNNTSFSDNGIGAARVQLTYAATKQPGDQSFTLHTTGGSLRIDDPGAGRVPLVARVEIDALVEHGQDVLRHVSAFAELVGNGGPSSSLVDNFQLLSQGFDIQIGDFIINLDSNVGFNEVGAELRLRPLDIPIDLSGIVDNTPITISVTLDGEVRAIGAETIASAFFRDPTQIDNPDPLSGGSTITFQPLVAVPEPPVYLMLAASLLMLGARRTRGPRPRKQIT